MQLSLYCRLFIRSAYVFIFHSISWMCTLELKDTISVSFISLYPCIYFWVFLIKQLLLSLSIFYYVWNNRLWQLLLLEENFLQIAWWKVWKVKVLWWVTNFVSFFFFQSFSPLVSKFIWSKVAVFLCRCWSIYIYICFCYHR